MLNLNNIITGVIVHRLNVQSMTSSNGNLVPNQFIISLKTDFGDVEVFKSYNTIIAYKHYGSVVLDNNALEYSRTTSKYLKEFLNTSKSKKDLYKLIESGEYLIKDLNA